MSNWAGLCVSLLGIAMIAVALLDILVTTLHPSSESVLSGRFYRILWAVISLLARRLPLRGRRRLLRWLLPGSIAGLLLSWLLLLLLGFGLFCAPQMSTRGNFASAEGPLHWTDAFYYSGMCLTSIGFGDIVPRSGLLRGAAVSEGICGLLVVGVAITYVLAVFPVLPLSRVLATTLNEESNGEVDALPMVQRYLAVSSTEVLAGRCRELALQISGLTDAHTTHPVLFYAHPRQVEQSFLRALLVTQRLVVVLRYGLRTSEYPDLVRDPRVVGLEESLIAALRQMGASLHLHVAASEIDRAVVDRLGDEYDSLQDRLRAIGLRRDEAVNTMQKRAFVRFRLVTDPYISAYWANSGYTEDEVWSDHPPLRGTTAPLPNEDEDDDRE